MRAKLQRALRRGRGDAVDSVDAGDGDSDIVGADGRPRLSRCVEVLQYIRARAIGRACVRFRVFKEMAILCFVARAMLSMSCDTQYENCKDHVRTQILLDIRESGSFIRGNRSAIAHRGCGASRCPPAPTRRAKFEHITQNSTERNHG